MSAACWAQCAAHMCWQLALPQSAAARAQSEAAGAHEAWRRRDESTKCLSGRIPQPSFVIHRKSSTGRLPALCARSTAAHSRLHAWHGCEPQESQADTACADDELPVSSRRANEATV
jgi:hypothetical protein